MSSSTSLKTAALVSVTAAATALLIQACGGGAVAQSASDADPIEGVWDSTVTIKDCTSGAVQTTFKGFLVFHRGGTMQIDSTHSALVPPIRGSIYGTWKRDVGSAYTANLVHLRFNPDSTLAGTGKIQRAVTVAADGNNFTATLAIRNIDTAGVVQLQRCASETAARVTW